MRYAQNIAFLGSLSLLFPTLQTCPLQHNFAICPLQRRTARHFLAFLTFASTCNVSRN